MVRMKNDGSYPRYAKMCFISAPYEGAHIAALNDEALIYLPTLGFDVGDASILQGQLCLSTSAATGFF